MSRTIVIFGLDYWPDETGIAPYTTGFAEHLAQQGDNVHVAAGMPYYPQWKVKTGYQRALRLTEERNGVRIHRYRQFIPGRQSAIHRAAYESTFLASASVPNGLPKSPDLVIGVMPALSDGILAARYARKHSIPLTLWIQDLIGQAATQSGMPGGQRIARATARVEGWIVRQATSVGIVAEGFRPVLHGLGVAPERIHRLRNWTHIEPPTMGVEETRRALGLPLDRTICLHAGNMGYKQGLENIVGMARLAAATAPELFTVLLGDGNQRARLEQLAHGLTNLRFVDPIPASMFSSVLAAADVLLVNQRGTVTDMSLPSKLTSYLAVNRPVVAAVHPQSETAALLDGDPPAGSVVPPDRPDALLEALKMHMTSPPPNCRPGVHHQVGASAALESVASVLTQVPRTV